ncbi:MAG: bifunctional riboflavin kinase/FAD synthetase [Coxiellaceae bacterium]|jgi:riboflavin kinase/FMN adenylyltransferase|nr:bifunctional riboflavin kinase/FAD synthetase [Coxiellaceae bacterium]
MRLIRGFINLKSDFIGCVVSIGNYDSVHLGHQVILNCVKKKSLELKLPTVIVTFEPQSEFFFIKKRALRLTSIREKLLLFKKHGMDNVLLLPLNRNLINFSARQFIVEILVNKLKTRHIVIGDDFAFGYRREGNYSLLNQEKIKYGFQVTQVPSFKIDGIRISSSLIRAALTQGNLILANKFLGLPYRVIGRIVHGDHRGRALGFPTANIHLKGRELPLAGVYAIRIFQLSPSSLPGIANVGFRPTVSGQHKLLEVHIFNFNANIYGKKITIEFHEKIRNEQKFNSLATLQIQINQDLVKAKQILKL